MERDQPGQWERNKKASHIWVNMFQDLPALVDIVNV